MLIKIQLTYKDFIYLGEIRINLVDNSYVIGSNFDELNEITSGKTFYIRDCNGKDSNNEK